MASFFTVEILPTHHFWYALLSASFRGVQCPHPFGPTLFSLSLNFLDLFPGPTAPRHFYNFNSSFVEKLHFLARHRVFTSPLNSDFTCSWGLRQRSAPTRTHPPQTKSLTKSSMLSCPNLSPG